MHRILLGCLRRTALIAAVLLIPLSATAQQEVDLELVLLADASGSIDNAEIRFQREGYAAAITHPDVLGAISSGLLQRIAVTYVEWGASDSQAVVVPWTIIDGAAAAQGFAEALLAEPRLAFGRNAIGSAIRKAMALIEENDIRGLRRVIDISADSANNWSGPPVSTTRYEADKAGIIINGLAILCRSDGCGGRPVRYDLEEAFANRIIIGPSSFVITVDEETSFADAVRRKLVLEIAMAE